MPISFEEVSSANPEATSEYVKHLVSEGFTAPQATSLVALAIGLMEKIAVLERRVEAFRVELEEARPSAVDWGELFGGVRKGPGAGGEGV